MNKIFEEYFKTVFKPVLKKIKDRDLAKKTVKAWVMAAEEGGWKSPEDIEKIPFTLLTDTKGINLVEHTIAVTLGAEGLANAQKNNYRTMPFEINYDFIYAGGLLHDVGKLMESEFVGGKYQKSYNGKCTRHPVSGAIVAAKAGLPLEIVHMIANHAKEGEGAPQRVETFLVHQADFATFDPMVMMSKGMLIQ